MIGQSCPLFHALRLTLHFLIHEKFSTGCRHLCLCIDLNRLFSFKVVFDKCSMLGLRLCKKGEIFGL